MDPQTDEHIPIAATYSRKSLIDYLNGGQLPTKRLTDGSQSQSRARSRRRACPVLGLIGLLTYFLICGSGVAISVVVVQFNLQAIGAGAADTVARILLFVASCMGLFYVLMHAFAARDPYVRSQSPSHIYGYFSVSVAVLIQRLGVPVWLSAVAVTVLAAANNGLNLAEGVKDNVVWIQLGIAVLGL